MLAPRHVVFIAVEGALLDSGSGSWSSAEETLEALNRWSVPWILSTQGTRAQLEPLRRKLGHSHPFLTERGGALFIPDALFNFHLKDATRVGRLFRVPFAKPYAEAAAATLEIAGQSGASVVPLSHMNSREIARNSGLSPRDAELLRHREFSELFFFAGETKEASRRFSEVATQMGWMAIPGAPFWELHSAVPANSKTPSRYLMSLYRQSLHTKPRSVGIGKRAEDADLLSAVDTAIALPGQTGKFDPALLARIPQAVRADDSSAEGWKRALASTLQGTMGRR